uniref:Uncharacterized protein n=1 Tax=Chelydra serpentina TaxID=8475 RepID=A0A8C3XV76_CHESE
METPAPPDTGKRKVEGQDPPAPTSLAGKGLEEAICYICRDYLTDPVTIECGHNFCRGCITQRCEGAKRHSCPRCGATFQRKAFMSNTQLGSLVESIKQLRLKTGRSGREGNRCEEHGKELTWFCKEDSKHLCEDCRGSPAHRSHAVIPMGKASHESKVRVALLANKPPQGLMSSPLWTGVSLLGVDLTTGAGQQVCIIFGGDQEPSHLRRYAWEESCSDMQRSRSPGGRGWKSESVLAKTELGGGWETAPMGWALPLMLCPISAVNVILDPDTAHPSLMVSENGRSVKWRGLRQDVTDNPKRFDSETCVLGQGFTSGRHYWEVDVGGGRTWGVGVAGESVRRKGWISFSPEERIWAMDQCGSHYLACTCPGILLPLTGSPGKIGVYLDYEQGLVSFYHSGTEALIFTFTSSFTEQRFLFCCFSEMD